MDTMATSSADMQSGKETNYEPKHDVILRLACQMGLSHCLAPEFTGCFWVTACSLVQKGKGLIDP